MCCELVSGSAMETRRLGRELADVLGPGRVIALVSELGGGKTVLAKGIAEGMGLTDTDGITSPTFTLVHRHDTPRGVLYHVDLYRLAGADEARDIGLEEILDSSATVIVEWADRAEGVFDARTVWIRMAVTGWTARRIRISCGDEETARILAGRFPGRRDVKHVSHREEGLSGETG